MGDIIEIVAPQESLIEIVAPQETIIINAGGGGGSSITDWSSITNKPDFDALYYSISNPNSFITSGDAIQLLSGISISGGGGNFSLNGLTGNVNLTGFGNITVFKSGQNVIVSGDTSNLVSFTTLNNTGQFLQNQITSIINGTGDFVTTSQTGQFASNAALNNTGQYLVLLLGNSTGVLTGAFYPLHSNPSGYVTGLVVRPYETGQFASAINLQVTGDILQNQINSINGLTGSFVVTGQTGQFASAANLNTTGQFLISLTNTVSGAINTRLGATGSNLQSQIVSIINGTGEFLTTGAGDSRYVRLTQTGQFASVVNLQITGDYLQTQVNVLYNQTGNYYLKTNPSGFITGVRAGSNISVTNNGDATFTISSTGLVHSGQTGDFATIFNLVSTGQSLTSLINTVSGALNTRLGQSGSNLQAQINALSGATGEFLTTGAGDARYVRLTQSGQFASAINLNLTGSGLQVQINAINNGTGVFITTTQTGQFASAINLTNTGQFLQTQIDSINAGTGVFITEGQTGQFQRSGTYVNFVTGVGTVTTYQSGQITVISGVGGGGGVTSLNGLTSAVTISGAGTVTASINGQVIIVSGEASSGPASSQNRIIGFSTDGAGVAVTSGVKSYSIVPFAGTITGYTIATKQSGTLSLDIYKTGMGNVPTNSICGANFPNINGQFKVASDLSGWATSVSLFDNIGWSVRSGSVTQFTLQLIINPS